MAHVKTMPKQFLLRNLHKVFNLSPYVTIASQTSYQSRPIMRGRRVQVGSVGTEVCVLKQGYKVPPLCCLLPEEVLQLDLDNKRDASKDGIEELDFSRWRRGTVVKIDFGRLWKGGPLHELGHGKVVGAQAQRLVTGLAAEYD